MRGERYGDSSAGTVLMLVGSDHEGSQQLREVWSIGHHPAAIRDRLVAFGGTPVLLCFESAADIQAGRCYCHRHLVATWLEDTLGIAVPEHGTFSGSRSLCSVEHDHSPVGRGTRRIEV